MLLFPHAAVVSMFNINLKYSREVVLKEIGVQGFERLRKARVAVVGLGATGSLVADLLARAGIGFLRVIDGDTVDVTNLHRQILYSPADVGSSKAEAAARKLLESNPDVKIESRSEYLREDSANLLSNVDLIIDGTDSFYSRRIINGFSLRSRIPWIFMASVGTVAQVKAVIPGRTSCLDCFIPEDQPDGISCQDAGVLASSPQMASAQAWTLAVQLISGTEVTGDLFFIDPWNYQFERIRIARNPACRSCSLI